MEWAMNSNLHGTDGPRETRPTGARDAKTESRKSKLATRLSTFNFRLSTSCFPLILIIAILLLATPGYGTGFKKKAQPKQNYLAEYIARVRAVKATTPS